MIIPDYVEQQVRKPLLCGHARYAGRPTKYGRLQYEVSLCPFGVHLIEPSTPEEQAACSPDATKFCKDEIPDTFRVLACLQEHRDKLHKACQQILKNNGQ